MKLLDDDTELEVSGCVRLNAGLENTQWVKLSVLRSLLATQGLRIIGKEEAAILDKITELKTRERQV